MTSISTFDYTLRRFKDSYYLKNNTSVPINYSLIRENCLDQTTIIPVNLVLEPNVEIDLNITMDGDYVLYVNSIPNYFNRFSSLRKKLIDLIEKSVCSENCCKPVNCLPKDTVYALQTQSLFTFLSTYYNLIKPYRVSTKAVSNPILYNFLDTKLYENKCLTLEELCNQLFNTSLDGIPNINHRLFNIIVAIHYFGLYFYEMNSLNPTVYTAIELEEELAYIKNIYKYVTISKCITRLGLSSDNVLQQDTSNIELSYWVETNLSYTITEVVANIGTYHLNNNLTPYTTAVQGMNLLLPTVGRLGILVKPTISASYILLDALGNNITNSFEMQYLPSYEAVLFFAKDISSTGSPYIRIKSIF